MKNHEPYFGIIILPAVNSGMIIGSDIPIEGLQKVTGKYIQMNVNLSLKTSPGCSPYANSGEVLYEFTDYIIP